MKPSEFLNSINYTKKDLMRGTENDTMAEKSYSPWYVNKTLSYFSDTIFAANMMNCSYSLDNRMQYTFYINIVSPKKRFSKWVKKEKDSDLEAVMAYYDYNRKNAKTALQLLSTEQLNEIKSHVEKGSKT